jgi:methyltransferase (TIGR00027 family)
VTTSRHSTTAEGVALARAAHQLIDAQPPIFADALALRIIGPSGEARLRDTRAMYDIEGMRRARASISIRSRFTEEELARAIGEGTRQYVILGAGLDTFAYRRTDIADRLTVYEVDQPDTQRWKQERLADAGIPVPANVRFVPTDFNDRGLEHSLAASGFQRDLPALFSWLGVLYYLPRPSIVESLRFVAGQKPPGRVVFDFALAESSIAPGHEQLLREFTDYNRDRSERWRTWFTPEEMRSLLEECGFREIVHLDYEAITRRYLDGRADGLLPSPLVELISARN